MRGGGGGGRSGGGAWTRMCAARTAGWTSSPAARTTTWPACATCCCPTSCTTSTWATARWPLLPPFFHVGPALRCECTEVAGQPQPTQKDLPRRPETGPDHEGGRTGISGRWGGGWQGSRNRPKTLLSCWTWYCDVNVQRRRGSRNRPKKTCLGSRAAVPSMDGRGLVSPAAEWGAPAAGPRSRAWKWEGGGWRGGGAGRA